MMVRCCRTYEEVYEGDVGKVIKLDRDGLHDLNVQCDWQQKGGTYWVRYIHTELLGNLVFCPTMKTHIILLYQKLFFKFHLLYFQDFHLRVLHLT